MRHCSQKMGIRWKRLGSKQASGTKNEKPCVMSLCATETEVMEHMKVEDAVVKKVACKWRKDDLCCNGGVNGAKISNQSCMPAVR